MGILETINSPADLRALDQPHLSQLAEEVRAFLVEQTSRTGGHLSPNLGVVELTTVLRGPSGAGTRLCIELAHLMARHGSGSRDSWPPAPRNS